MAYTINGTAHTVDVDGDTPLLWVLRDVLDLTGTKFGCGAGLCGACTVHVAGAATRSCVVPVDSVGDSAVTTIEAVGETLRGKALQRAWLDLDVQIMSAAALLEDTPDPSDADIDDGSAARRDHAEGRARGAGQFRHLPANADRRGPGGRNAPGQER
jgi:isoquinoline 1-oxidoreductase subunit alpha